MSFHPGKQAWRAVPTDPYFLEEAGPPRLRTASEGPSKTWPRGGRAGRKPLHWALCTPHVLAYSPDPAACKQLHSGGSARGSPLLRGWARRGWTLGERGENYYLTESGSILLGKEGAGQAEA